jgi:hypothetical protein
MVENYFQNVVEDFRRVLVFPGTRPSKREVKFAKLARLTDITTTVGKSHLLLSQQKFDKFEPFRAYSGEQLIKRGDDWTIHTSCRDHHLEASRWAQWSQLCDFHYGQIVCWATRKVFIVNDYV